MFHFKPTTIISAKVIADSISNEGIRLSSMECVYPAFFHQDVMTHRRFGRSALSTRAIPVKEMRRRIRENMATPTHWGRNQPGMQAETELEGWRRYATEALWRMSGHSALMFSGLMNQLQAAKQVGNMVLWPYIHFKTLITSTDYANFFALRDHAAARPELQFLAQRMKDALAISQPQLLYPGEWHMTYIHPEERLQYSTEDLLKISTARSARLSYDKHDGKRASIDEEMALYRRLIGSAPVHASPAEHQATPDKRGTKTVRYRPSTITGLNNVVVGSYMDWNNPDMHGNLIGWCQNRKLLAGEATHEYDDSWKNRDTLKLPDIIMELQAIQADRVYKA